MDELGAFLNANTHLTPNSRRAYTHAYKRIMEGLTKSLKNAPQHQIIEHIETLTSSPNTKNQ